MKLFLPAILLVLNTGLFAAEADHFTIDYNLVVDIGEEVNQFARNELEKSIIVLNQNGNCASDTDAEIKLYEELKKTFANHSKGTLVKELLYGNTLAKTVTPLKESVYGDWSITDGYILGKKSAATSSLALSPVVRIKDEVVGIDKFEHMFGMGFIYFNQYYLKNKSLIKVLKSGILKEKTYLGGNRFATGVFSYGDLSANFNGMRFWNHILQKHDDVLGKSHNLGPYLICKNNQWIVNSERQIDFSNYIDGSMDESINCSKFASNKAIEKFHKIAKEKNILIQNSNIQCPLHPERLQEVNTKYNVPMSEDANDLTISHWIINNKGHGKVNYFNEF